MSYTALSVTMLIRVRGKCFTSVFVILLLVKSVMQSAKQLSVTLLYVDRNCLNCKQIKCVPT